MLLIQKLLHCVCGGPGIVVFEVDYILLHSLVLLVLLVAQIEEARPGSGLMRLIQYSSNAEHPSD